MCFNAGKTTQSHPAACSPLPDSLCRSCFVFCSSIQSASGKNSFIEFILFFAMRMYSFLFSIPIKFLFNFFATAPVVPVPKNGSNTTSPCFVVDKITLFSNSSGFCVECAFFHFYLLIFQSQCKALFAKQRSFAFLRYIFS